MEFHEKLQALRKQKGLTQEALAEELFVSRAAISKWESGRGYPNIDSLKMMAKFFSVTIDTLLSCDEVLTIAETDHQRKEKRFCDLIFGLLDCSMAMLLVLPFFGQKAEGMMQGVSLLSLTGVSLWLKTVYFSLVIGTILWGVLTLALQNCEQKVWVQSKHKGSVIANVAGAILFIISLQPYAAVFVLGFLGVKVLLLIKKQ